MDLSNWVSHEYDLLLFPSFLHEDGDAEQSQMSLFKCFRVDACRDGMSRCTRMNAFPRLCFRFATREPNGLLLYNGRFNEKHDFIAMEIINEQIQLTYSAGRTFSLRLFLAVTDLQSCFLPLFTVLTLCQARPKPQFHRTSPVA